MNSVLDHNIFNSINPDSLTPKEKRPVPFPLENFDEELGNAYQQVERLFGKLHVAQQNPVNHTPARKRKLKSLKYKTKTCLQLLREVSTSFSDLWY